MVWSMVFGMGYDMCYFLAEPKFVSDLPPTNNLFIRLGMEWGSRRNVREWCVDALGDY